MEAHDFSYYGITFDPSAYGFMGTYPVQMWSAMQRQFHRAWHMASGNALEKLDVATKDELYPLRINLWDFVAEIHATMMVGIGGKLPPRSILVGDSKRSKKRAEKYTSLINSVWSRSNSSLFWSSFYNSQVYGGYPLVVRRNTVGSVPFIIEGVPPEYFYPVFDSSGNVLEFFIAKKVPNRVAELVYGVRVKSDTDPDYVEHWSPTEYSVRIDNRIAKYPDGSPMAGENFFGVAPGVYVPHLRKAHIYGDSQILGLERPVLEFNARVADVSTGVRDMMQVQYWARNVTGSTHAVNVGPLKVHAFDKNFEERREPEVHAFETPSGIGESMGLVNYLWDLVLYMSKIPGVAIGIDEGSQRSGMTLRVRFWSLDSHCQVERSFAEPALNELARIVMRGAHSMGAIPSNGDDLDVSQVWPEMLPQDRAELVNEMVQRRAGGLVSLRTAIRRLDDYEDLEEEIEELESEEKNKQEVGNGDSRSNRSGDIPAREVSQRGSPTKSVPTK